MKSYSMDVRERVIAACEAGEPTSDVAESFGVSPAWVRRLKQRLRTEGTLVPKPSGGDRRSKLRGKTLDRVRKMVEAKPDLTLEQLRDQIQRHCKIELSIMSVCRALQRIGLSLKKNP